MKVLYMGTPDFAVEPLIALYEKGHEIVGVVTQPDRPGGKRGLTLVPSAVKKAAEEKGLKVFQPEKVYSKESADVLSLLGADVIVVCAYGQILKKNILTMAKFGCLNIHASLLPKYRGAAPMHRAIMNGEKETGVSIMLLNEGLDTGDILLQKTVPIKESTTVGILHDSMSLAGSEAIVEALDILDGGDFTYKKQEGESSYAEKISKEECKIDFQRDVKTVYNHIRALNPFPCAYALLHGKRIKLYDVILEKSGENLAPGQIGHLKDGVIPVGCNNGSICLKTVKPEGKRLMEAKEFYQGLQNRQDLHFE